MSRCFLSMSNVPHAIQHHEEHCQSFTNLVYLCVCANMHAQYYILCLKLTVQYMLRVSTSLFSQAS